MPAHVDTSFARRVGRISRTHRRMARGTATYMRKDGLLVMRPRRGTGLLRVLKASALVVAGGIAFKAFLLTSLGPSTYQTRLTLLENGTMPEQYASRLMAVDPATQWLADQANDLRDGRL